MQDRENFYLFRLQKCLSLIPRNAGHFVGDRTKSLLDIRKMGPLYDILHILKLFSSTPDKHYEHADLIRSIVRQLNTFCSKQLRQIKERGLGIAPEYAKSYARTHIVYRIGSTWTIWRAEIRRYVSNASAPIPKSERYTLADYVDEEQKLRLMLLSEKERFEFELSLPWLHIACFLNEVMRLDTCVKGLRQIAEEECIGNS